MGGLIKRTKEQKTIVSPKTIDIVSSYALKVSVNGVTYVFVVLFRVKKYI